VQYVEGVISNSVILNSSSSARATKTAMVIASPEHKPLRLPRRRTASRRERSKAKPHQALAAYVSLSYNDCSVHHMERRVGHAVCSEKPSSVNSLCRQSDDISDMVRNRQIVVNKVTPRTISAWSLVTSGGRDGNIRWRFLLPSCHYQLGTLSAIECKVIYFGQSFDVVKFFNPCIDIT